MEDITKISRNQGNNQGSLFIKEENKNSNIKDKNNLRYSLTNKSFEDSEVKEEEIDINMKKNQNNSYKEKQLSIFLEEFETSYSKKYYKDLIKDIEEKEDLLYSKSLNSFKIKMVKIKASLKLLMKEYDNYLQSKNKSFHELEETIHKIKNEFKRLPILLIYDDSYVYEMTTQIYCKFLYLLSKISLKREDYINSLGYVTLGINMLKIFFLRKKIAYDIKTYKIYCKLVLEIINILICDKNYEQALYFSRLLFKIIEIAMKFIYYTNNNKNMKIFPTEKIYKYINFGGIGYIYTGCCLEQLDDPIQAFEAYKQAKLFFKKGEKLGLNFPNYNIITINNSFSYLTEEVFKKLKLKFEKDKIDRLNRQKRLELQKKKEEIELLQNEKLMKLKFIANGIGGNPFKFQKLENTFNQEILSPSVVNNLEKIDDDLTSFVFTYFDKNKNYILSSYNRKMSSDTKKIMTRYEAYNILMSKKFREFIKKTKKLQFYNPKSASKSISIIQRYLNNKIHIDLNSKTMNNSKRTSIKINNDFKSNKINNLKHNNKNMATITNVNNIKKEDKIISDRINKFLNRKKNKVKNIDFNYQLSEDKDYKTKKSMKKIFPKLTLNMTNTISNIKFKLNKDYNMLESDFERKNLDKNLMSKNYLRKYDYYNKLSGKELKFQKELLNLKSINTLYNKKNSIEEKEGIIGKDELETISLIINEKAKKKVIIDENLIDINLLKESFGTKQNKVTMRTKSALSTIINNYLNEKNKNEKVNIVKIQKSNKQKILYLDNCITNINNNISQMKYIASKSK